MNNLSELPRFVKFELILSHKVNHMQNDCESKKLSIKAVLQEITILKNYLGNSLQKYKINDQTLVGSESKFVAQMLSLYLQNYKLRYEHESNKRALTALNIDLLRLCKDLQENVIKALIMYK